MLFINKYIGSSGPCDDLVKNPNGSASTAAGNNLFGMLDSKYKQIIIKIYEFIWLNYYLYSL